ERRAARDRRDRLHRRLLVPALLPDHLHPADQGRRRRRRLLLLHVQLGRAADGEDAHQRQRQADRRRDDAHRLGLGHGLGRARRSRGADDRAGRDRHLVRASLHRQGLRHGPGLKEATQMFEWMAWTLPVAVFFTCIVLMLAGMTVWELRSPTVLRKGFLPMATTRGDRLFIGLLSAAYVNLAFVGLSGRLVEWMGLQTEP